MIGTKPWYTSKTIWAGIISVMAALSGFAGFPLDATTKNVLVENALQLVTAIAGIFAILGRISASTRISSSLNSN